ncbi:MAG: bifunctional hydroxymethylpyrimidine kinase/phosphomethylpyrimidine kinase [Planctomycetes bacterium]|nr:bifunctional hydroxymethylpyrimidine kinase/phosphomethylpyrimidine kinase [Planctomycetota bacterium]
MTRRLLLLGGLDPSGGAGLTVDAIVAAQHGCQVLPVATAWTVQNGRQFTARHAPAAAAWQAAFAAALADGDVHAVKVGMLADAATAAGVAAALAPLRDRVPIVVDPVLVSTAPGAGPDPDLVAAYRVHLLPLASLLLPNAPEAAALAGGAGAWPGHAAVLAKGGHGDGPDCDDVLTLAHGAVHRWRRPRLPVGPVRGTGCALATAIAARLAHGDELASACRLAGDWLHDLLRQLGPASGDGLPRCLPLASPPSAVSRTAR